MSKQLIVSSTIQKHVLEKVLLEEIKNGFWKGARPNNHAEAWVDVTIEVGSQLGACGFQLLRNYNFVNPEFFKKYEAILLETAKEIQPDITAKQLKKHLISLNQILGSRLTSVGGTAAKLQRGKKSSDRSKQTITVDEAGTTRKVLANFVDAPPAAESNPWHNMKLAHA